MKNLQIHANPEVTLIFNNYPDHVKQQMFNLRALIIETAEAIEGLTYLEETLKWGEPSYLTKKGSTIRIDWKSKNPDQYAMYFQCTSKLIPTFKSIFPSTFNFEGTRAIVFKIGEVIPTEELKYCITAALMYHKVKHLPTLGI